MINQTKPNQPCNQLSTMSLNTITNKSLNEKKKGKSQDRPEHHNCFVCLYLYFSVSQSVYLRRLLSLSAYLFICQHYIPDEMLHNKQTIKKNFFLFLPVRLCKSETGRESVYVRAHLKTTVCKCTWIIT